MKIRVNFCSAIFNQVLYVSCFILGSDIRRAFTDPLVPWSSKFYCLLTMRCENDLDVSRP